MKKQISLKTASSGLIGAVAIASGTQAYADVIQATLPLDLFPAVFPTPPMESLTATWDVNGDGIIDFNLTFRQPETTGVDWQANIFALGNSAVLGYVGPYFPYPGRLNAGDPVVAGGANTFLAGITAGQGRQFIISSRYAGIDYGQFQPPNSTGFIGFQFTVGTDTFNGYIELKVGRDFGSDFISAAYNNTPGGPITAGQAPIPEPGSLAFLAVGAAGLAAVAARRRAAKKSA